MYTNALTRGECRSCGCLQRESRFKDISGEVRGHLTAIRPTGEVKSGSAEWEWRCVCGNIKRATEQSVGPSNRTSCGCMRKPLNIKQAKHMQEECKKYYVDGTNILSIYRLHERRVVGAYGYDIAHCSASFLCFPAMFSSRLATSSDMGVTNICPLP